jgi:CRP-like cAMP-binding protein
MTNSNYSTQKLTHASNYPSGQKLPQRIFERREIIPERHDMLWRIERGAVRSLTWSEDGTYTNLGYWGVGDIIGYPLSRVSPYQIECLITTEVTAIPPHLWHEDIGSFISHIQQIEELSSIVNCKRVPLRMWGFLLWLGDKFGRDIEQGKLIDLHITHQDIAEVLNTTRVTVTRLLMQFEEEEKIIRHKRRLILKSPKKFLKIA